MDKGCSDAHCCCQINLRGMSTYLDRNITHTVWSQRHRTMGWNAPLGCTTSRQNTHVLLPCTQTSVLSCNM